MFEWLVALVRDYGLPGLFASSFIGSTIFVPFSTEVAMSVLVVAGVSKVGILAVATLGSVCGTMVNYYIGYQGLRLAGRYVRERDIKRARDIMNRYGWLGVFGVLAVPVSLPVDPLTILCGASRMDFREFTAVVLAAKLVKYALVLGLLSMLY